MKSIARFLAVLIVLALPTLTQPAHAQFTYTFYPNDATINSEVSTDFAIIGYAGGSYDAGFNRNFTGPSSPTVQIANGALIDNEVDVFNSSIVNVTGGAASGIVPFENSVVNVSDGFVVYAVSFENSVIHMTGGYISDLEGQGKVIEVSGGQVDTLVANTNTDIFGNGVGGCIVDVTGGNIGGVQAFNEGILNYRGGTVAAELVAAFGGTINVYGDNLAATLIDPNYPLGGGSIYSQYALSGLLADGTVLTNTNLFVRHDDPGNDGSVGQSSFHLVSAAAPEPSTLALVFCGGVGGCGLFLWRRGHGGSALPSQSHYRKSQRL